MKIIKLKPNSPMKKLILIIVTSIMATTAWAQTQQLITVKGKTKDGKSINVQYYKGNAQDYIESVKYQLVDELKTENKNKQNVINDLTSQLNKANKRIDNLNEQIKKSGNSGQNTELQEQLDQKQGEIDQLNEQLNQLNAQMNALREENEKLKRQNDSIKAANLRLSQNKSRQPKSPVIGVEFGMGSVLMSQSSLDSHWNKELTWNKQAAIYFGTDRLMQNFPLLIEAGIGFRSTPMAATMDKHQISHIDTDGDPCLLLIENLSEKLTANFLEVPIRVCFGQPNQNKVSVYGKVGVTPGYLISANLTNTDYTRQGKYQEWNVTLQNINELGYFNNDGENTQKLEAENKFALWANAIVGAYVPLSSSILFNVGAKLDYPIIRPNTFSFGSTNTKENTPSLPAGVEQYKGSLFIPSLQAGLVYRL